MNHLEYFHPEDPLITNGINWNDAKLIRRKRLFHAQKMEFEYMQSHWEKIKERLSRDYLQELVAQFGDNWQGYECSLQVQVIGRGNERVGKLILHYKDHDKNKILAQVDITPEDAIFLLRHTEHEYTRMDYVKTLVVEMTTPSEELGTSWVTRYLGRHSGIYHQSGGLGDKKYRRIGVSHSDEYHRLQGLTKFEVTKIVQQVKINMENLGC